MTSVESFAGGELRGASVRWWLSRGLFALVTYDRLPLATRHLSMSAIDQVFANLRQPCIQRGLGFLQQRHVLKTGMVRGPRRQFTRGSIERGRNGENNFLIRDGSLGRCFGASEFIVPGFGQMAQVTRIRKLFSPFRPLSMGRPAN